ncbi:MAG TPA: hypothetical protein VIM96_10200 [Pseudomonadales bacterium]|jgi:hypothetical protein
MSAKTWCVIGACLLLLACSRVDKQHYDQLLIGQPFDEVKSILGAPGECTDILGGKRCQWGNNKKWIKVTFVDDSVLFFNAKGLE